ncbi:efflux transporter outer membrane subunit [Lacisediminimonas sp.]|uniref:efflux transporter outer membrane subunit n=1 Tax=Lacisediminimonas sp. TaxID=3060582 RepID=UPI00271714E2|nr:efflux transporter outer membrane subunit [Lacisediminimonas sp.]MDO8299169.1 efflux transporter outer membrane subunit [Lacisediminimonas sp.]
MTKTSTASAPRRNPIAILLLPLALAACAVGPDYQRPAMPIEASAQFKQAGDWVTAAPADAIERGAWWELFGDPMLNDLMPRVAVSNQNVAAAAAAYAQARALVSQQRAAQFPSVNLSGQGNRNASDATSSGGTVVRGGTTVQVSLGASWEPDVWGRIGRAVEGARAGASASAADLATATLSAQGELAANYFSLRATDAQRALLADAIVAYERVLQITRNRYEAGLAPNSDLLQAQTQLANSRAEDLGLTRQRAQLEHAIAVLTGVVPAQFALAPLPNWQPAVPAVPVALPSVLLQRRPDIAAAERRVAQANEQIGIAQAAWYPSLGLTASYGLGASTVAELFSAPTAAWSLGLSTVQAIFNAGLTRSRVEAARAGWEQTVARYRQTVLTAFQGVEDQLAATRVLSGQLEQRRVASTAASQAEVQFMNRYRAGQAGFTEVVSAQVAALNARRAVMQAQADQLTTAVALIQALGGGWKM